MTTWADLDAELTLWEAEGLTFPFWWRDDDAVADTPALRRLSELAAGFGLPIGLAVVPAHADPGLARMLAAEPHICPLVHGLAHENHAPPNQKKAEFGLGRPLAEAARDAKAGLAQMRALFGDATAPVFVPPWNRIRDDLVPELAQIGFTALSTHGPRTAAEAAPGLARINTHIDPIDWRGTRSLPPLDALLTHILRLLHDRRTGRSDADEPLGLLTHHLVHDEAIWSFCAQLAERFCAGPARPWHPMKGLMT